VFFNAESAENAENGKDWGIEENDIFNILVASLCVLCALCVEMTLRSQSEAGPCESSPTAN
jgi:hypothetical protein